MQSNIDIIRAAIDKVTKMLSGMDIEVTQRGAQAFVLHKHGKPVRVNIPFLPDGASEELIAATQGFLDHEVAHVLFTDGNSRTEAGKDKLLDRVHNIIEDCFIERKMTERFKGSHVNLGRVRKLVFDTRARPYIEAMEQSGQTDEVVWFKALTVTVFRALAGHQECVDFMNENDRWKYLPTIKKALEFFPEEIEACQTSWDTLDLSKKTIKALESMLKDVEPPPMPPEPGDGEESDEENNEEQNESSSNSKKSSKSKNDGDNEENDEEDSKDETKNGSSKNEAPDEEYDNEEDREDQSKGDKSSSPKSEEDTDDADTDGEGEKDADTDDTDTEGENTDGDKSEDNTEGENTDDDKSNESDDEDNEGDGDSDSDSDGDGDGDGETNGMDEEDVKLILKAMLEAPDAQEAVARDIEEVYRSIANSSYGKWLVFSRENDGILPYEIKRGFASSHVEVMQKQVNSMIGPMSKEIERLILSRKRSNWDPGRRSGRLNPSSLHRLKSNDDRVFRRKIETKMKNTAVQLLVDISGSMAGSKANVAMYSAFALAAMLDRCKIPVDVFAFTTRGFKGAEWNELIEAEKKIGRHFSLRERPLHLGFKRFDERMSPEVTKRFADFGSQRYEHYEVMSQNCDPESVRAAALNLIKRQEERKILMVLSDGQPAFAGDYVEGARELKKVVKQIEKAGIEVVGIGIQDSSVKQYYPKHVILHSVDKLPQTIMKEMKALLLK